MYGSCSTTGVGWTWASAAVGDDLRDLDARGMAATPLKAGCGESLDPVSLYPSEKGRLAVGVLRSPRKAAVPARSGAVIGRAELLSGLGGRESGEAVGAYGGG
jgi:hypothetical protein